MVDPDVSHAHIEISRRAVFIDRDGTICREKSYMIDPGEFDIIPGVPQALKRLQDAGFLLVVVTNQSGVARGYFTLEQVNVLHEYMKMLLAEQAVSLAALYVCPHHPTVGIGEYQKACSCRKGNPGMLLQASRELNIDLRRSFMIGDKKSDIQAGQAAGCRSYIVRTGYGERMPCNSLGYECTLVEDLRGAAEKILREQDNSRSRKS
jgi:D-glycero-D-manno-heptose 1,7-bisphosphate phosphatase